MGSKMMGSYMNIPQKEEGKGCVYPVIKVGFLFLEKQGVIKQRAVTYYYSDG